MIKLKDILNEGFNKQDTVDKVYPFIVRNLGSAKRGIPKVEFHTNIYARLSGDQQATGEANPHAEYDWDKNKIYLYTPRMTNVEEIIKALLHEYTHATQDRKKFELYREKGYANNPYEKAAHRAERNWKRYTKYIKTNESKDLNECIITHSVLDGKVLLAKNRDRAYTAKVSIVRELLGDVELVYILDKDTDWSEGMNNFGIGIVNSALMVNADEKEKKIAKKKGKPSEDGLKIRKALSYKSPAAAMESIVNYTGEDKIDVGVKGHTFIATPKASFAIELTSEHQPILKKLNRKFNHARTNHGYAYKDSGYTSGPSKSSSEIRWAIAQKVLNKAKKPNDILDGLSGYWPVDNMRNNPFRNADMVKNPNKTDILSTTGQIMMNLNDLEFIIRMDQDKSEFFGIDDRTPDHYKPQIKIRVEHVKNTKIDNNER